MYLFCFIYLKCISKEDNETYAFSVTVLICTYCVDAVICNTVNYTIKIICFTESRKMEIFYD